MCEICSKLTIKTPERRRSGVLSSLIVLVFPLLTLNKYISAFILFCNAKKDVMKLPVPECLFNDEVSA